MNLYIETENGVAKNHPAFEDNLIQAFGSVPEHWMPFERVQRPVLNMYQIMESETPTYAFVDGVWKDVWHIREMTAEEKEATKQATIKKAKDAWSSRPQIENWSTWVFNEETFNYEPPIPHPAIDQTKIDAGIKTVWCGAENNWKDTPAKPVDENQYKFDFIVWQWVQVVDSTPV
jgi:hypothetical protein